MSYSTSKPKGQVHVSFKSDQAQWHSSRSSFLTESLIVWIFLLFSPNFSPKDLDGFKADIAFIYTTLACSLAISTNLNFDLNFVTRNFIGSCVIRCAIWLVSRKDHCLERVLRKYFWIKKLINTISLHLLNNFEKYFVKAIENFSPYFYSLIWTLAGLGEFSNVMQTLDCVLGLHNVRVENSPSPPRV